MHATADGYFVREKHTAANDMVRAREATISYAAYRVLVHRYQHAVGGPVSEACFRAFMNKLGFDPDNETAEGDMPRAIGNRIGAQIIAATANDGANEANDYADTTGWMATNPPLVVDNSGAMLPDSNHWQQLNLAQAATQNGIITPAGVQTYIGAQWGLVTPFAMTRTSPDALYHDPGPPPAVETPEMRGWVAESIRKSAWLDTSDGATLDISPGAYGNNSLGANDGHGNPLNPVTGAPYPSQVVLRGNFGRVLAEFWADGPKSETPPGHWFVIANYVSDQPELVRRMGGVGPELDPLEWDVKTYLALGGAVHDAAITAWEIKRRDSTVRPISLVRWIGGFGQSSDPGMPSYDPRGLPLEPGVIEIITPQSSAPGERHAHLSRYMGQVAVKSWRGEPGDRTNEIGGVGWIRAVEWIPYQRRTFVTPAFPGFTSGHSTFSRAAAEVLTAMTGSPNFPRGLGEFVAAPNAYLTFERGPSAEVRLQWATYYDAADQAGQSRIWGGIHIEPDDFNGRRLGSTIGKAAFARAQTFFAGTAAP